jgi:hypothetical protein
MFFLFNHHFSHCRLQSSQGRLTPFQTQAEQVHAQPWRMFSRKGWIRSIEIWVVLANKNLNLRIISKKNVAEELIFE